MKKATLNPPDSPPDQRIFEQHTKTATYIVSHEAIVMSIFDSYMCIIKLEP